MKNEKRQAVAEEAVRNSVKAGRSTTVVQAIDDAATRTGAPNYLVARGIFTLREEGKVSLVDPSPPQRLPGYVGSPYGAWFVLLLAAVVSAILSIYVLPSVGLFVYIRYVLGSFMVLFLPGYALIEALYPKKRDLDGIERLALSIGLSLALVPLVGLALNYTPWGIRLDPIVASLSVLTFALGLAAAYRKLGYLRLATSVQKGGG